MKKALFIRSLKLGDSVLFSPIVESFHRKFPDYKIDLVTYFKQSREFWEHYPYVDIVFIENNNFVDKLKLILKLRKNKYEYVFVSSQECGAALKYYFVGAKYYIGFKNAWFYGESYDRFYFLFDKYLIGNQRIHDTLRNFKLLEAIGIKDYVKNFVFYPVKEKKQNFYTFKERKNIKEYAIISLIGHSPGRNFPLDMWKVLVNKIGNKIDLQFLFIGTGNDFQKNEEYIRCCKGWDCINLSGETDFDLLYYFLEGARFLLTVDNGIMHFASIFDINKIVLWGPGNFEVFSPQYINNRNLKIFRVQDITCGPCQYVCNDMICYKKLDIDDIANYITNLV